MIVSLNMYHIWVRDRWPTLNSVCSKLRGGVGGVVVWQGPAGSWWFDRCPFYVGQNDVTQHCGWRRSSYNWPWSPLLQTHHTCVYYQEGLKWLGVLTHFNHRGVKSLTARDVSDFFGRVTNQWFLTCFRWVAMVNSLVRFQWFEIITEGTNHLKCRI